MAISRDKLIIGGVVVLAGLSALVYKQAKKDQALGTASSSAALPDPKGTDDVDKLEITNGTKSAVTLEKQGDKWMVTKPVNFPANQGNVKQLLDNVKELKAKEIIASTPDDDTKKTYEVDADHGIHVVGSKAGAVKFGDVFGKSGGRGEMMLVDGHPELIGASGYSSYLYSREVTDWRDREIFKFDDANASTITIVNKTGKFSFTKGDKWAGTLNGQPIPNYDDAKVADALRAFKNLIAEGFADGKSTADTGLDKPTATVTVSLKDNAGTYTLKVGDVSTGTSHYAMKDGDTVLVTVNPNVANWATADATKFAKAPASDAGAPTAMNKPPHLPK